MTVYVCDECDNQSQDVAFCPACHTNYCDQCWQTRVSHKKGLPGPLGIPHERVDPAIVQQLKDCMAEPTEEDEHRRHRDDEDTTWFGVEKDAVGSPILAEYRRYAAIMMQSSNNRPQARYPGLVSFVGQTRAGKSSLINLLIDLESSPATQSDTATDAPVIGRSSSTQPTSADVHLYICPSTIGSDRPILYADCEGFEGGDRNPIAAMAASSDHISAQSGLTTAKQKLVQKFAQSTKRILKWAIRDSNHHEDRSKRG